MHFSVSETHGNDARPLSSRARLCVSAKVGATSSWLKSEAARGKITEVPLVRVRDMIVPSVPGGAEYSKLSPSERAQQKGDVATSSIAQALMEGTLVQDNKLIVADLTCGLSADWARGSRRLIKQKATAVVPGTPHLRSRYRTMILYQYTNILYSTLCYD